MQRECSGVVGSTFRAHCGRRTQGHFYVPKSSNNSTPTLPSLPLHAQQHNPSSSSSPPAAAVTAASDFHKSVRELQSCFASFQLGLICGRRSWAQQGRAAALAVAGMFPLPAQFLKLFLPSPEAGSGRRKPPAAITTAFVPS